MSDPGGTSGEAELLAAAGRGDERSASVLYDTYADGLYAYGLSHLRDRELAEELVQRVLEKLWRRAEAYDPDRGPVRAYVFAIARSTTIDLQRRVARHPRPVGEFTEAVDTVTDAADQILTAASVRAALDRLTPDHRRVLELAYTRDLDQRAIADVLRLPLGTVKSRTFYALKAFRLACDELGVTR